jgi:hypothetical protein
MLKKDAGEIYEATTVGCSKSVNGSMNNRRGAEGKMTDQTPYLTRYLVRKGTTHWMVWDRHGRAPARLEGGRPAVGFTEEQAREIKDELTKKLHQV